MRALFAAAVAALASTATYADAQVTGVVTSSTATMTFRPDSSGNNIVYNYSGPQIGASNGSNSFGSGGVFASTSKINPGSVAFQNGSASSGAYVYLTSQTDVAVTFTNGSASPVTPQFRSQIIPAGLGVYVGSQCLASLTSCPETTGPRTFQSFNPGVAAPAGDNLAGSSIDFRVLSGGVTIYDIAASVDLVYDPLTGTNVFVTDIAAAQATLNGFHLETTPGSQTQFGFNWQATDLDLDFPGSMSLAPSQSATLTYQTTVQTYSRAGCFNVKTDSCLIAYSSVGDPIGGGMGIKPSITALSFQSFAFAYPTFQSSVLSFQLASVPEPATWTLTIFGIGSIGAVLRRRRRAAKAGDPAPQTA